MTGEQLAWAIFFLPLLSFVIISFLTYRYPEICGFFAAGAIGSAFVLSLWLFSMVVASPEHHLPAGGLTILSMGDVRIHLGAALDSLTALM
ncbi:MAG: hypothetical protein EXR50_07100, partial [Dehalococcoidia bacterium]|nr:hypothetical protein [Dehalococcoidia bacterium]